MRQIDEVIAWLLEGAPYIVYRTRRDLLDLAEDQPQVSAARRVMLAESPVQSLIIVLPVDGGASIGF